MFKNYFKGGIVYSSLILIFAGLQVGCGDNSPVESDGNSNGIPDIYTIETEPSMSPDRDYIFYVAIDTTTLDEDGIWKAKRKNPHREKVLLGNGFRSPVLSFDNNTVTYLKNSRINYYRMSDNSSWSSNINQSFESIMHLNGNLMLGCRDDSIFIIDETNRKVNYFKKGWDPGLVSPDNFIYMTEIEIQGIRDYIIVKSYYPSEFIDTVYNIGSLPPGSIARWPTMEPQQNRISYTIETFNINYVYATEQDVDSSWLIDTSKYNKSCIISYNGIIYTGQDGRFYLSNFRGTTKMPYWGAYNVQSESIF
jgi:hypothetical protein